MGCSVWANSLDDKNLNHQDFRYNKAISGYEEELFDNPQNPDAYYHLGIIYYLEGNETEAVNNLKQAEEYYKLRGDFEAVLRIKKILGQLDVSDAIESLQNDIIDLNKKIGYLYEFLKVSQDKNKQ